MTSLNQFSEPTRRADLPPQRLMSEETKKLARTAVELAVLPPSFEMIPRLLLLLDDENTDSEALATIIRVDAGLTADILHVSNAAAFRGGRAIETLEEAIIRLGLRELYRAVMRVIASPVLNSGQEMGLERLNLWSHSLACALAAQTIATQTGYEDPEVAFTAGLLHDLGKMVLAQALRAPYIAL